MSGSSTAEVKTPPAKMGFSAHTQEGTVILRTFTEDQASLLSSQDATVSQHESHTHQRAP